MVSGTTGNEPGSVSSPLTYLCHEELHVHRTSIKLVRFELISEHENQTKYRAIHDNPRHERSNKGSNDMLQ